MAMRYPVLLLLSLLGLAGCEQLQDRLGIPDPTKTDAEAKAIGGACRHAGRGLEDCYTLNPKAPKAAVYDGWKEMNEYMTKNRMEAVPPKLGPEVVPKGEHEIEPIAEGLPSKEAMKAEAEKAKAELEPKPKAGKDKVH